MKDIIVKWDNTELPEKETNGFGIKAFKNKLNFKFHRLYAVGAENDIIMSDNHKIKNYYALAIQQILRDSSSFKVIGLGLGLGLVQRTLLKMIPNISEFITIEKSEGIANLISPIIKDKRHKIIIGNGLTYSEKHPGVKYVFIDLWSNFLNKSKYKKAREKEIKRWEKLYPSANIICVDITKFG